MTFLKNDMKKIILIALITLVSSYSNAQLTYKVRVPNGTKAVYLRGDMNGWGTSLVMTQDAFDVNLFTISVSIAKAIHKYKYCAGPDWAYEELTPQGFPPGNRSYPGEGVEDVVAGWRMIYDPSIQVGNITLNATVPASTKNCFVVGSFNSWAWGAPTAMTKLSETQFTITLPKEQGISYKYTSGSNSRYEEVTIDGAPIQDRTAKPTAENPNPTITDVVAKWKMQPGDYGDILIDMLSIESTPYMTIDGGKRTVMVYMPNDYKETAERYPVMYMLDGQNIFSPGGPYGSWDIDVLLEDFQAKGKKSCIIVGINNSANRGSEYNPIGDPEKGADKTTMPFIVNILKPYIDANYRTLPQREYTGLGGSSLGGITSAFGVLQYQDVFSRGCLFSPSYWYNHPAIFDTFMNNWNRNGENKFRLYQIGGTQESTTMTTHMQDAFDILKNSKGFTDSEIKNIASPTMLHNEASWKAAFIEAFEWLWEDYIIYGPASVNNPVKESSLKISIVDRQISVQGNGEIQIFNLASQKVANGFNNIVTNSLPVGVYFVVCQSESKKILLH